MIRTFTPVHFVQIPLKPVYNIRSIVSRDHDCRPTVVGTTKINDDDLILFIIFLYFSSSHFCLTKEMLTSQPGEFVFN